MEITGNLWQARMTDFKQDERLLDFTTVLGTDVLLIESFAGTEAISELFHYKVELLATVDKTVDPKKLVGTKAAIGIQADDSGTQRYINGIIASFEFTGGDEEFNNYRAYIVPNLWVLTLNKNTRVFQDKTVTDVVKAVLSNYNISPAIETSATYTPMEYCTQYRETDFDFISRLMEQHGIFYYFKHTYQDHTCTLQDTSSKLAACAIQDSFRYAPQLNANEGFYDFVVKEFNSKTTMVTGHHLAWDYSFIKYKTVPDPLKDATTSGPLGANNHEEYDYADSAAAYLKKEASDPKISDLASFFGQIRKEECDAGTQIVVGTSNAIPVQTGYSFSLTKYPQTNLNTKYLITRVEHTVQQLPSYRSRKQASIGPYSNTFTSIPFSIPFRAPFRTPKPVVNGMHTGQVVVPSGEDSYMDKYGRVCVQFFWDRLRKPNTTDNTLLRVAQPWAGKGWGTYFWPRVDDEVLIDFMEGDPDQPIVVGSVYNGVNMPKYDPAGQYTLSGILTRSSKNGGAANANELRFEDLQGKEQIFMNAERDYDLHVEHDWHTTVGNQQHTTITDNQYEQVGGESHLLVKKKQYQEVDDDAHLNLKANQIIQVGTDKQESIGSNLKLKIGQDSNINVGQNLNEKIGMNYSSNVGMNQYNKAGMVYVVDSGQEVHIKGGMTVVIEGGMGVCLSGPGGFVSIDPSGVTIQGMLVKINSGGAALQGSPAQTQDPVAPGNPTAPTAPTFPGDDPYSKAATSQSGAPPPSPSSSSNAASSSSPAQSSAPSPSVPGAVSSTAAAAQQEAQQAANGAQQAAQQAEQSAQQAQQQAQQAVNQVTQQARQEYQQAQQAVQQAQQAVNQATQQGKAAAQQALNQAEQQAQQTAQAAAQAVQQAQKQAQQVEQQAQQAAQQAQQQAQQAEQQAQKAAQQAQQQGQQAAQQAQQAAQQAEKQAQQAAQQAQQQAQQAQKQVQQAASGAQQQAQQASQAAQQSAAQAMNQAKRGF
jgi:type VI secretion system secreted protein VgrG